MVLERPEKKVKVHLISFLNVTITLYLLPILKILYEKAIPLVSNLLVYQKTFMKIRCKYHVSISECG